MLSIIVACAALLVALIAVVRGKGAENAAEEARTRADEALARSNAAVEAASSAAETATAASERAATAAQTASAASRQAGEADAAARAAENLAERAQAQATQAVARAAAATEEAALARRRVSEVATTPSTTPDAEVRWECERLRGADWVARNVGSAVAQAALVTDASRPPKYIRPEEVIPRDVQPGDHLPFRATSDSAVRSPRIRLTWTDETGAAQAHEMTLIIS